jgi:hypothetical protein
LSVGIAEAAYRGDSFWLRIQSHDFVQQARLLSGLIRDLAPLERQAMTAQTFLASTEALAARWHVWTPKGAFSTSMTSRARRSAALPAHVDDQKIGESAERKR